MKERQITIRDGIVLNIYPDSRDPFEHFISKSESMVAEMDQFIQHSKGKHRFLDIGALHGIFSLVFSKVSSGRSIAIEPSPIAFSKLLYNIHANDDSISITPHELALCENPGTLQMHYKWEHLASHPPSEPAHEFVTVNCVTADCLCHVSNFRPDIVKIDVEGHELKVLRGMLETISSCAPVIFLEVHPEMILLENDSISSIGELLSYHGYKATFTKDNSPCDLSELGRIAGIERIVLTQ